MAAETLNQTGESCDDGDACNGANDQCVQGQCEPSEGASLSCDDDIDCTIDDCDAEAGCVHIPSDSACDDDIACTADICDAVNGCTHAPEDATCEDGFPCTINTCDPDSGCTLTPDDGACNDQNACTNEVCDPQTGCETTPVDAPDCSCCTPGGCNDEEPLRPSHRPTPGLCRGMERALRRRGERHRGATACGPRHCYDGFCNFGEALYGCQDTNSGPFSASSDCNHNNPIQGDTQCINDDWQICAFSDAVTLNMLLDGQFSIGPTCISLDPVIIGEVTANTAGCNANQEVSLVAPGDCSSSDECIVGTCNQGTCQYYEVCEIIDCSNDSDCESTDCNIVGSCQMGNGAPYCTYSYDPDGCQGFGCTSASDCQTSDPCLNSGCDTFTGECWYEADTVTFGCYPYPCTSDSECYSSDTCIYGYCEMGVNASYCSHCEPRDV